MWNPAKRWPEGGTVARHATELRQWAAEGVSVSEMARRIHTNRRHIRQFFLAERIVLAVRPQTGSNNPHWRGGRIRDKAGYILVLAPDHPHANACGYVREHRLILERVLGRYLLPTEVVDHFDGRHANNRPSNLRLFASNRDHLATTLAGRVPQWSEDGKARIRAAFDRGATVRHTSTPAPSAADGDSSPAPSDHQPSGFDTGAPRP